MPLCAFSQSVLITMKSGEQHRVDINEIEKIYFEESTRETSSENMLINNENLRPGSAEKEKFSSKNEERHAGNLSVIESLNEGNKETSE